jgi:serine/threonine protein kinase
MKAIVFTKENCSSSCKLQAEVNVLIRWSGHLHQIMNHFGFHDNFKVFKKIGKGSFASVYLAERNSDKKQVAIKAFSKSIAYAEDRGKVTECGLYF